MGVQARGRRFKGLRQLDAGGAGGGDLLHRQQRLLWRTHAIARAAVFDAGHVIYSFPHGIWESLDATWYAGGRSTLDGVLSSDLQRNWRVGGTLAFPVDRYHSVEFYASNGVSARTGNDYDLIGVAWQTRWGGGL